MTHSSELYQQLIIDHSKKPRNFGKLKGHTHVAEGYNPLCGDHLWVYLKVDSDGIIQEIAFEGSGCAISKASASLMTMELKGKQVAYAEQLFQDFHGLLTGSGQGVAKTAPNPDTIQKMPPKLGIFSNIWQYPARVKCAALSWHAMNGALHPASPDPTPDSPRDSAKDSAGDSSLKFSGETNLQSTTRVTTE